jgi:hypothetical protein
MEWNFPLGHETEEVCITQSLTRKLLALNADNRKRVVQWLLPKGWVLSSPAREKHIAHLEMICESAIKAGHASLREKANAR